ncbi:winged helix-turn-helix domain-containing protein [Pseudoalteromonas luteoviolacea]|uniref:winged helix family transcriptional regulator n=1 Tax=Pseudoalteromonas luteoviolacea TaxID=43657 RepID=UPI001B366449|nr:winged helix family transcriptional regulator [Pseudoalteromonas luteoviolacea]MBQ4811658.1 winged helix-turn-helix domain-containing protein [Pseudoalteromonas luteoviolacea]
MLKTANKGQWVINHRQLSLENGIKVVELDSKQYALLVLLLKFKHQDVSKTQILSEVWGQRVVSEDAIYVAVNGLRKLLGDDAKSPKYIKTISGVGYRWVGPPITEALPSILDSYLLKAVFGLLIIALILFWQLPREPVSEQIPAHLAEPYNQARFIIGNHPEELDTAIDLLQAITVDSPDLIEPLYWLAKAHFMLLNPQTSHYDRDKLHLEVILQRILKAQPAHKAANLLFAKLVFMGGMDVANAEPYFQKSLPSSEGHHMYGQYLLAQGKIQEALKHIKIYQSLDPNGFSSESVAWVYMMSSEFEQAHAALEKLRPYSESNRFYHVCLRAIYEQLGEYELALNELMWVMNYEGYSDEELAAVRNQFSRHGMQGVYQWLLFQDTRKADVGHYAAPMSLARYAAAIGDNQLALHYLEQSRLAGQYAFMWVGADPHFLSLRKDESFNKMVGKYILKSDKS